MDSIDELYNTLGALRSEQKSLDPEYLNAVQDLSKKMMEGLSKTTGEYLHNLHTKKPSGETLEMMIDAVPSSLSHENGKGQLPVQKAVWSADSIPYIPLLAFEGVRHNVGGTGKRGGLLVGHSVDNKRTNVLELLANLQRKSNSEPYVYDTLCLNVLKGLKESNLFLKQDIQDYNLLTSSCRTPCQLRFDYLAEMDPEGLKKRRKNGRTRIHTIINSSDSSENFQLFLTTALKHHPEDIGLLFQRDDTGKTAFECALNRYGNTATFGVIEQCIPLDGAEQLPILHRVVENAPLYSNEFGMRYPSSMFIREKTNGRKLHQSELASGNKTFDQYSMFFLHMSDEQVREIDSGTGLYPFMVSASGETSDLSAVYHLLRRNPSLVNGVFTHNSNSKRRETRTTVSVDRNIISASLNAVIDALIEYPSVFALCDDFFDEGNRKRRESQRRPNAAATEE